MDLIFSPIPFAIRIFEPFNKFFRKTVLDCKRKSAQSEKYAGPTTVGHLEKLAFAIFSRLRRVVTRWIIANYNIVFSKLPLKTEVFRGSHKIIDCRRQNIRI